MTLIDLEDVSLIRQGKTLLKSLNWQVRAGESWVILGLNGSGKTSLLRLLLGEYWPTEGRVSVLGTTFGAGDMTQLRQKVGVVGSFIAERFPSGMTVEQIVLTGKYKSSILYKAYGLSELQVAGQLLSSIGGQALLGRSYASLSQGEKQLVLIARSLMENPHLLILDEATSGLDLFAREALLKQIGDLTSHPQSPALIYVTHHIEEITESLSHVLLLKDGKIVAAGPKAEVLTESTLSSFYGTPVSLVPIGDGRLYAHPSL